MGKLAHGLSYHPLYPKWIDMKKRCYNPNNKNYHHYGGRGIEVCDEWKHDFKSFHDWSIENGWSKGLTIDRIDTNKDYSPDNCRYVSKSTQSRNRRKGSNNTSGYRGVSKLSGKEIYIAEVSVKGKKILQKRFKTAIEAAKARDLCIVENNLKNFILNFE